MKKIIFVILLSLGFTLAETPKSGWAYVISAIGVKNSPNNVVYTSGDTSASSNANYVLSPQVIVWDDALNYVGSLTPFTGCLNSQHYSNGKPSGFCFTGGLATTEQDGLMSKEDKTKLNKISNRATKSNYLDTISWYVSEANTVTWTRNQDGTFTVTGTVTANGENDRSLIVLYEGKNNFAGMKFIGNPLQGNPNCWLHVDYITEDWKWITDGNDIEKDLIVDESPNIRLYIWIKKEIGQELNLTFKPMLTDNLDATMDDYIPFDESLVIGGNIGMRVDLLWINNSLDSPFTPQKIIIEQMNDYKFFLIQALSLSGIPTYYTNFAINDRYKQILYAPYTNEGQGNIVTARNYTIVNDGIIFETGTTYSVQYGIVEGNDDEPNYCKPVRVYGIK